jgi:fibronectin-binding autotransporter adhesin
MKLTLSFTLFVGALTLGAFHADAAERRWVSGGVISSAWSDPDNWDPEGAPQDGDDLRFAGLGGAAMIMINDLTGLRVNNLWFDSGPWQLTGNPLRVSRSIANGGSGLVQIHCDIRLEAAVLFSAFSLFPDYSADMRLTGAIDLNGHLLTLIARNHTTLDLAGPISGNGRIVIEVETLDFFSSAGTVKFSGNQPNTFTGDVTLSSNRDIYAVYGAHLVLDKQSGLAIPGALTIGNNALVKLDRPHQIADATIIPISSGGRFFLQGNTESIRGLTLDSVPGSDGFGGPVDTIVDTGGATLSVEGNITSNHRRTNTPPPTIRGVLGLPAGSHTIHTTGTAEFGLSIEAQIIGEGGFTKTGNNALILEGNNSFNGDSVVQEGSVWVSHNNALGAPSGATILEGGELSLDGVTVGPKVLLVNRSTTTRGDTLGALLIAINVCSWAGPVVLNTNATVAGGDITFSGQISGPGGVRFLINDRVHLTGPEGNTYAGDTLADAILLELNKPSGVAAFGGRLLVDPGSGAPAEVRWLQNYQRVGAEVILYGANAFINLNNHREDFGPVTFYGGVIDTGPSGELGLYGLVSAKQSTTEAIINGRIGLPPGHHEFFVEDGLPLADLLVNAAVIGAGHLRKTGPGQMWLSGQNSYTGLTFVDEGALVAYNADALGASGNGTAVKDGASLILNASGTTVREPIAISGPGDGAHGALDVFGDVTLRNPFPSIFACLDLTTNATIRVELASRLTVDGIISGTGPLTKTGPGLLVMANINPNTYSGDTFVTEGVLDLSKPNLAISVPGNLIVGPAPLNSSAIARWSTSGGMNPGAIATINAGSLLDLNGNSLTLSRLNLNDGGDAQTGAGVLNFGLGGMIAVGSLSLLGSHAGSSVSGNLGLPANATLTFAVGAFSPFPPFEFGPELDASVNIAPPPENPNFERAGIAKSGPGTMRLFGNTSFNGRVDVLAGTFIAANGTALGSSFDGTFVFNDASLGLEGSSNFEGEILVLNSTATPALDNLFGDNYWSGQVIMNRHSTVGVRGSTALQLAGVISGAANFTKIGPGTLRFGGGGHNTYTGETFINEGIFLLGKPLAITAVPGPLSIGTPAGVPATVANLVGYQIIGNIFVNRAGLYNLNGQEENVDHLWLSEGGDVSTTTGFLYLKTGGSVRVFPQAHTDPSTITGNLGLDPGQHDFIIAPANNLAGSPELIIAAVVSQPLTAAGLRKLGAGTLRLTANNSYSGSTVVAAGTLQVNGSQPTSQVTVQDGARLAGTGRAGRVTFGDNSGIVAPGLSPGNLQVGTFNGTQVGGILQLELNGVTPDFEHDRLTVRGLADLTGMTLQASVNFPAAIGDQFMIIGNDFFDLVTGEFNGLPQDGTVTFGDHIFQINYFGGDGNDVVLTKTGNVFHPLLTIQRLPFASVRLLWPTNDAFSLQFNTNLSNTTPGAWTFVPEPPVISGTNRVVTNSVGPPQKFYRLIKP